MVAAQKAKRKEQELRKNRLDAGFAEVPSLPPVGPVLFAIAEHVSADRLEDLF